MAKKYVRAVARSNLDLESRKNVRQKEAELAVRRKAAFIGKEVRPRIGNRMLMCLGHSTATMCHKQATSVQTESHLQP